MWQECVKYAESASEQKQISNMANANDTEYETRSFDCASKFPSKALEAHPLSTESGEVRWKFHVLDTPGTCRKLGYSAKVKEVTKETYNRDDFRFGYGRRIIPLKIGDDVPAFALREGLDESFPFRFEVTPASGEGLLNLDIGHCGIDLQDNDRGRPLGQCGIGGGACIGYSDSWGLLYFHSQLTKACDETWIEQDTG